MLVRISVIAAVLASAACAHDPAKTASLATLEMDPAARPVLSYRWKLQLEEKTGGHKPQEFASTAIGESGTRLYVGSRSGRFYAVERQSGRVLWRAQVGSVSSAPLVNEGRVYIGTDDGALICLSALDGEQKWRYQTRGSILEPPQVSGDLVFFSNAADHVFALDRRTGKFRWQYKSDTPDEYTLRGHAGVAVTDELVISGFSNGNLVALRGTSGSVAWITSLAGGNDRFVDVDSTPRLLGSTVYASSSAGGVHAVDVTTGRIKWKLPVVGAGPIATDSEALFFGAADEGIFAIDLTGNVIWRQGTRGGGEPAEPTVDGPYVLYSLSDAGMFIADKKTGAVRQYFDPGFGVSAPPTVDGDELFVVSNGAVLYALGIHPF